MNFSGTGSKQEQSVLFADVCRSSQLFELYGDTKARQIIAYILEQLAGITVDGGGRVVKTIGDEVMCTFPTSVTGIEAAIAMQLKISGDASLAAEKIAIRVGVHYGSMLVENDDVFGDAVNTAQRLAVLAGREQIVTTQVTLTDAAKDTTIPRRALGQIKVKGRQEPVDVAEVLWKQETSSVNQTAVSTQINLSEVHDGTYMRLTLGGKHLELLQTSAPATLGRDGQNDLVVPREWVSRNHVVIEYRRDIFVLTDRSTNGTFVREGSGGAFRVHRDEAHLREEGVISLGKPIEQAEAADLVQYVVSKI